MRQTTTRLLPNVLYYRNIIRFLYFNLAFTAGLFALFFNLIPQMREMGEAPLILISTIISFSITGLILLLMLIFSNEKMTLSNDAISFYTKDKTVTVPASDIQYIYVSPTRITTYGSRNELIYSISSGSRRKMIGLFKYYGYHVVTKDPYKHDYVKWYPNHPGLDEIDNDLIEQYLYYRRLESTKEEIMLSRLMNNGVYIKKKAFKTYFRKATVDPEMIDPFNP